MCGVIDANCLKKVFTNKYPNNNYEKLNAWFLAEKRIVIGGSRYKEEIKKSGLGTLFVEYKNLGYLKVIEDEKVDRREKELKKVEPDKKFNDSHIIALIDVGSACLLCTEDYSLQRFAKEKRFFKGKRPKIFCDRTSSSSLHTILISANCNC